MRTNSPTHDEIARRAREIWQDQGRPFERDTEFWLEAERELSTPTAARNQPSATDGRGNGNTQASRTSADPKPSDLKPDAQGAKDVAATQTRLRGEMAAESAVEYNISPPIPEEEAIKVALQKREVRSPQVPERKARREKPVAPGKPLWKKPHSA